jgi:hypothetical protein
MGKTPRYCLWARKIILSLGIMLLQLTYSCPILISILSTDGGGVKGYSSLLILEQLMEEIKRIEAGETEMIAELDSVESSLSCPWISCVQDPSDVEFFLHHYVDYFFGTSTGG